MKKNYTKFSEASKETENELENEITVEEEVIEGFAVTEEDDGVHVKPVVDGEILDTEVEEIITPEIQNEPEAEPETELELEETEQEEVEEEIEEPVIKHGYLVGCTKLNVRAEASKDAAVILVVDKDTTIDVNVTESEELENFYAVSIYKDNAIYKGYCMKQFLTIK